MAKKKTFDVLSPDGFSIHHSDTYKSIEEAQTATTNWIKNYERQGYYSSVRGRIPLDEVASCCRIIEV